MVYISSLQKETLKIVDDLINKGNTFDEIQRFLFDNGYTLRIPYTNSGILSKSRIELCDKNNNYSFVDLIKKRNGNAVWETIKLS